MQTVDLSVDGHFEEDVHAWCDYHPAADRRHVQNRNAVDRIHLESGFSKCVFPAVSAAGTVLFFFPRGGYNE
jgi:hypothetical protein